ncbi:MAG: FtsX-like permease family protein [Gemmatimonadaceae bacterium]
MRTGLLIAQGALSIVLLVGAGLFVRSLQRVRGTDLGFDPTRVVVAHMELGSVGYSDAQTSDLFERMYERVRVMPGVAHAALAVNTPFWTSMSTRFRIPGRDSLPRLADGGPYYNPVTPDYFATLGTRIVRGRGFGAGDRVGSPRVMVISQRMANLYWPGVDAIGQCAKVGSDTVPCSVVVGIAEDIHRQDVHDQPTLMYYIPLAQKQTRIPPLRVLYARTDGDPARLVQGVRREMQSVAANLPYANVRPMQDLIDPQIRPWRLGATMFGIFGVIALLVAAVGLYSVLSYTVVQRTHEMGVRMALGAQAGDVLRMIVGEGVRVTLVGIALGAAIAFVAGRGVASLLFETKPNDPLVFGMVTAALLLASVAASALPAWRATRVDPSTALRAD